MFDVFQFLHFAGVYVANRASDKITQLTDNVYVCRSGSVLFFLAQFFFPPNCLVGQIAMSCWCFTSVLKLSFNLILILCLIFLPVCGIL